MGPFFFRGILWLCFLATIPLPACEAERIGKAIYWNECSGKKERLVWWNTGENFASLGIGHFIWYPKDKKGLFEETFPALLHFFKEHGVELPLWLNSEDACPWSSQAEFLNVTEKTKKEELQDLLSKTIPLQTVFLEQRLEKTLPLILASMSEEKRKAALKHIERLKTTPQGKFALIDYLNFKGTGLMETERYQGKGWGLKQVLEEMPADSNNTLKAFCETARVLLKERVKRAPVEERWLQGWLARIERYAQFT